MYKLRGVRSTDRIERRELHNNRHDSVIYRKCAWCQKEFVIKTLQKIEQETCSYSCRSKLYASQLPSTKLTKTCANCGKEFVVASSLHKQTACSHKCAGNLRKVVHEKRRKLISCKQCGKVVEKSGPRLFCSASCRYKFNRGPNHPRWSEADKKFCIQCGKMFFAKGWRRAKMYCSPACGVARKRQYGFARSFPIGAIRMYDGYRAIKTEKGWLPEHRVIAEKMIGRPLLVGEIVHHINGIPNDNREENLAVVTKQEHMAIHAEAEKIGLSVMSASNWMPTVEGMEC